MTMSVGFVEVKTNEKKDSVGILLMARIGLLCLQTIQLVRYQIQIPTEE